MPPKDGKAGFEPHAKEFKPDLESREKELKSVPEPHTKELKRELEPNAKGSAAPLPEKKTMKTKAPPSLDEDQKAKLECILTRANVALQFVDSLGTKHSLDSLDSSPHMDFAPGSACSSESMTSTQLLTAAHIHVEVKKPLSFRKVKRGNPPEADFQNEHEAMISIGDVAELLHIYSTAMVLVQGHTATPEDKIDVWATELAQHRSDKVKSAIVDLGVSSDRITSKGFPGKTGDSHPDVVIKILEFAIPGES